MNADKPKATWSQMFKEKTGEMATITLNLSIKGGIIITNIRTACNAMAIPVRMPSLLRFFMLFKPVTSGSPNTNENIATTDNVRVMLPIGSMREAPLKAMATATV